MKVLPEQQEYIQSTICDVIVADPLISIRKMQEVIKEKTGRSIGDKYISKLMEDSRRIAVARANRDRLNERMNEIRERYKKHQKGLNFLAYKTSVLHNYKPVLESIKLSAQLDLMLLRAEIMAGAFDQGAVEVEERVILSRTTRFTPEGIV